MYICPSYERWLALVCVHALLHALIVVLSAFRSHLAYGVIAATVFDLQKEQE